MVVPGGSQTSRTRSTTNKEEEMKRLNSKGFTLVEIMIVVAIIALLAAIAIPNLLRAKIAANDSLAASTLKTLSTAAETFATSNNGDYPATEDDLLDATPPYINRNYCDQSISGFTYECTWDVTGYSLVATPGSASAGSKVFTITVGGVLVEVPFGG
jgi:prepilin-type N-terminal cleavage/methylation domain-containing protein